jgi:20S proteasome subunit beta 3
MEYNGAAIIAMAGKNCVAIASDLRLGIQAQTISNKFEKIFPMTERLYVGLAGLATDTQTVSQLLKLRVDMYELQEDHIINPKTFACMTSSVLYERRFSPYFVEPVIAGLEDDNTPFICSADLIGCLNFAKDFVVSGTCAEQLFGMCESLWEPDLEPDDLFETISQSLINAVDRDALSGWGAIVHVITPDKVITRRLKTRQD